MTIIRHLTLDNIALFALPVFVVFLVIRLTRSRRSPTTRLKGPHSKSFFFGLTKDLFTTPDPFVLYENWENEYGSVYEIPSGLGSNILVLSDPKAIAHVFSKDTATYHQPPFIKRILALNWGRNLLSVDGEDHKRQRRALSSAFSNSAARRLTSVFLDSAHMVETSWDSTFQSTLKESLVIDVQQWMNYISLDSIGIGGFSHDFGSLKAQVSPVAAALDAFGTVKPSLLIMLTFNLGPMLPAVLLRLPSQRNKVTKKLIANIRMIGEGLFQKSMEEKAAYVAEGAASRSIIGALIKSESAISTVHMSIDEIMAQNLLIVAGYETTAISMTWALIELSRHLEYQEKLRTELFELSKDPTYEQLTTGLPYLDAIVCETLRLHPAAPELTRQAIEDDIIPLTNPIADADGGLVDNIVVAKGTIIRVPVVYVNRSEDMWGPDGKVFNPNRWLDETNGTLQQRAVEIQGYRHLLTFGDGPRTCLGRGFALTEFKVVLTVLIRNFMFELPDGPLTKIEMHRSLLVRPKVAGEESARVPLIVKRVE